ncbi:MAG: YfcE family phosphodiesterase [Oscillospiraceae bacterium]|nr:YfcE family phosphodiesterase [Oscillospiraceae bacterium]
MKLLVFSDSHGKTRAMLSAAEREAPDMIVHLGDHACDAQEISARFPAIPLLCVRGNCDFTPEHAVLETPELCGRKLFIAHGHYYGVKSGTAGIVRAATDAGANIVLFGHTHKAIIDQSGRTRLFNPGSISNHMWNRERTYGIIHLGKDAIQCEIKKAPA